MKIFISQSGKRSKTLALEVQKFVRQIFPGSEPWVSDTGIDKGTRSLAEIATSLETSSAGIICLTSENLNEPWILFEAGALSRRAGDRVWTLLLDIDNAQVEPPLGQFQHTSADKDDVYRVMLSINAAMDKPRNVEDLKDVFDALWPKGMGACIERLRDEGPAQKQEKRPSEEILAEVLGAVREIDRRSSAVFAYQEWIVKALEAVVSGMVHKPRPMSDLTRVSPEPSASPSPAYEPEVTESRIVEATLTAGRPRRPSVPGDPDLK